MNDMTRKILPYVYKLIHKESDQFYFGYRSNNTKSSYEDLGVDYFTSSKEVRPIFNQFNIEIIAEFFDGKDAWSFEQILIGENFRNPFMINKSYYKNGSRIFSTSGRKRTDEEKNKISKAKTGIKRNYKRSPEIIEKWRKSRGDYKIPPEAYVQAVKTRLANGNNNHSEETKNKISISMIGNIPWNKNIPMQESARQKLKETKRNNKKEPWNKGKKMGPQAEEHKIKRLKSRLGKRFYHNPLTGEMIFCLPENSPLKWVKGKFKNSNPTDL